MNYKITALKLQKKNQQRVNVYLDGEYRFGLARIVAAWLKVGQTINDEKIAQLMEEDAIEVAYQKALRFLQYRLRSEAEIRKYLTEHDTSDMHAEMVIERLKNIGLIDDEKFTKNWVENRITFHPRSRYALKYELRRFKLSEDAIEKALENVDDDALAYKAALRQARKYKHFDKEVFRKKMLSFLQRRGFNYATSSQTVDKVWEEQNLITNNINNEGIL